MAIDFTKIPFNNIVKLGQKTMFTRDIFTVSWILGRFCNYNCSYCWPHGRSSKKDHRDVDLILLTIDEIKRQSRQNGYNSFHFSFSGGEPTFHPDYNEIMQYLADDISNCNYHSVHMTSNCSRKIKWFEEYCDIVSQFDRASITASFHKEHVNTPEKVRDFGDKLLYCMSRGVKVTINQVMVPQNWDALWEEALAFEERGIHVTLKPQSVPDATRIVDGYTDDMLDKLHNSMKRDGLSVSLYDKDNNEWNIDQAERLNAFEFNKFQDWTCESGYRSIIVREPDGSIKRSYSCIDKPLGYIDKGFELFSEPKKCITPTCVSSADSKIPKYVNIL